MAETAPAEPLAPPRRGAAVLLLVAMGLAAVCGLVYELLAGALSSYLLGASVTQFSLVVGVFLSAMGIGSYLSQHLRSGLVAVFVAVEMGVGLVGGLIGLLGYAAFAYTQSYQTLLLSLVLVVGVLIGLEVPVVIRILQRRTEIRISVANVLSADYLGALAGSLLFPFLLVPEAGLVRAGLIAGLANVAVGWVTLWALRDHARRHLGLLVGFGVAVTVVLTATLALADRLTNAIEDDLFQDDVIYSRDSQYQHITLTRWRSDIRLYLDGNLQFSSVDEYRYHEALVHPAMALVPTARRVLILGGGDGLVAREVLKHEPVEGIDLVDLDPAITELFRTRPVLAAINDGALSDPRVTVHNEDAMAFLERGEDAYDVVIADLPDPNNLSVGKLYTRQFYRLVTKRLSRSGVFVTQASSPFETREAFWCIVHTIRATERRGGSEPLNVRPYAVHVPSFGEWGFVLASERRLDPEGLRVDVPTRFLTDSAIPGMFVFGKDTGEVPTPVNDLDDQALVPLYEKGYRRYYD